MSNTMIDFILPDIGEGIIECEIVEWMVKEGDVIIEDQAVAGVSTDKAVVEISSMYNGTVAKLYHQEGDIAKVHAPLFSISVDQSSHHKADPATTTVPVIESSPVDSQSTKKLATNKVLTTPAVRRLARENSVSLNDVPGTGKRGRVLKDDILNYIQAEKGMATQETSKHLAEINLTEDRIEPIKGVAAIMAKAMAESVSTIPHFTYADEIEMDAIVTLRLELKQVYEKQGMRFTLTPLLMKSLSCALKEFPKLNSRVNDDCSQLHYLSSHNIGMAVDSKIGLLVPNIKNVDRLSVFELALEVNRLTEAARAGKLAPADLSGGTITLSNIGVIGGTIATPIINKPEVAIVALGKIQELPRFDSTGNIIAKKIMNISWSGDHRVIDGATMARFSNLWKSYIENPATLLMGLR